MSTADQTRALLRADEAAVLRAVADYLAASYVPEQEDRQEIRRVIEVHLGCMVSTDGGASWRKAIPGGGEDVRD